jgi:hypothetical protein
MKRQSIVFVISLLVLFTGCKDLFDIEEDFSFQQEFVVRGNPLSYSESEVVDLNDKSSVVKEHADKIRNSNIKEIRIWVKSHNGSQDQSVVSASLTVAEADGSGPATIASMQNQNLFSLLGQPQLLVLNKQGTDKLNDLIQHAPNTLMVTFSGLLNEGPADFVVVVEFSGTLTANPLN